MVADWARWMLLFWVVLFEVGAEGADPCADFREGRGEWSEVPALSSESAVSLEGPEWEQWIDSVVASGSSAEIEILDRALRCLGESGVRGAESLQKKIRGQPGSWDLELDRSLQAASGQEFRFSRGNRVQLRVDADEFQRDVLRIVRESRETILISALRFLPDRFGLLLATELVARRLAITNIPELFQKLWGQSLESLSVDRGKGGSYSVRSWKLKEIDVDWTSANRVLGELIRTRGNGVKTPQIFLFSDRLYLEPQ